MKADKLTHLLAIGLVLTFVATGCKHRTPPTTPIPGYGKERVPEPGAGGTLNPGEKAGSETGFTPLPTNINPDDMNQDRAKFASETVHFEYDSTVIKSGE